MTRISDGMTSTRTAAAPRQGHFVTFLLQETEFAIEVADIFGIYHGLPIIPTPDQTEFVGQVRIFSNCIPVVSLRNLLELQGESASAAWLLVVEKNREPVGLLVDRVVETIRPQPDAHATVATPNSASPAHRYVTGEVRHHDRTIHVLDLQRLLQENLA